MILIQTMIILINTEIKKDKMLKKVINKNKIAMKEMKFNIKNPIAG